MSDTVPSTPEPGSHTCMDCPATDLVALVATIRAHAFDVSVPRAEQLIDIRDAIREYDGEFADSHE
jgi:hypothetical protein